MHLTSEQQSVEHGAQVMHLFTMRESAKLGIQERNVECRVVNDQLSTADEVQKLFSDLVKARLLSRSAM